MAVNPFEYEAAKETRKGTETAANIGAASTDRALALQEKIYKESQVNQKPWQDAGKTALNELTAGSAAGGRFAKTFGESDYKADPGYQFRLSEGIKALDRSASSKGQLLSGSALKGLTAYSQGVASDEYQNAYNRFVSGQNQQYNQLASLAGVGQTANNALGASGQNYANNSSNLLAGNAANQANAQMALANINASMYQGMGNSMSQGMNALGNWSTKTKNTGYQPSNNGYSSQYGTGGGYTDVGGSYGSVPVA